MPSTDLKQFPLLHAPLVGEGPLLGVGGVLVEAADGRQVHATGAVRIVRVVSVRHVSRCVLTSREALAVVLCSLVLMKGVFRDTDRQTNCLYRPDL